MSRKLIIRDPNLKNLVRSILEEYRGENLILEFDVALTEIIKDEFYQLLKKGYGSREAIRKLSIRYSLTYGYIRNCIYRK